MSPKASALQDAPAAQVLDRLAISPPDAFFGDVRERAAEPAARHVGDAAPGTDRDDKAFVVEREWLQRLARELSLQVVGHGLALFQGDLRQWRQRMACLWVDHRGQVARDEDLWMAESTQVLIDLDAAVIADGQR